MIIGPAGPFFSHHYTMADPDSYDFDVGVPVSAPVEATGRVGAGALPAARVAQATYHGDYEGLGEGWGELDAWLAGEGLAAGPDLWERYVTGPESGDDVSAYRTELNRPLVG